MRSLILVSVLLFSACNSEREDPSVWVDQAGPPTGPVNRTLTLTESQPAYIGIGVELTVTGAEPNQLVAIVASYTNALPRLPWCPRALNQNCFDIDAPEFVAIGRADATGTFVVSRDIPRSIRPGGVRYYQAGAAVEPGAGANLSDVVSVQAIGPCPGDDFAETSGISDFPSARGAGPGTFTPVGTVEQSFNSLTLCPVEPPDPAGDVAEYDGYQVDVPPGKVLHWAFELFDVTHAQSTPTMSVVDPALGGSNRGGKGTKLHYYNSGVSTATVTMSMNGILDGSQDQGVLYGVTFKMSDPCGDDLNEPNDDQFLEPTLTSYDDVYTTSLSNGGYTCAGDEDWFEIPASPNQDRFLSVDALDQQVSVEVYNADVLVASGTTVPGATYPFAPRGALPSSLYLPTNATLHVRIRHDSETGAAAGGWYHLSIQDYNL